jgi:hypothetical protein
VADKQAAAAELRKSAAEHGLHRWQQGYHQLETMHESNRDSPAGASRRWSAR